MSRHNAWRLVLATIAACLLAAASQPPCTGAGPGKADPRVVQVSAAVDRDGDRIADALQRRAAKGLALRLPGTQSLDVLVALDHPPTAADRDAAARAGARLLDSFSSLVYSIRVALPAPKRNPTAALRRLAAMPGVRLIEENAMGRVVLYQSTSQTGARRVWFKHRLTGRPEHSIAILDTGLDPTHPDFPPAKLAGWKDFVGPDCRFPAPYLYYSDKHGHGTAVASIACGSGDAAGIATSAGQLSISQGRCFHPQAGEGYPMYFPVDTYGYPGEATVTGQLQWKDTEAGYTVNLCLMEPGAIPEPLPGPDACRSKPSDDDQPLVASGSVPSGKEHYAYSAFPVSDTSGEGKASAYWVGVSTPMSPIGDGRKLMSGVAPGCRVVAVKVLDDRGLTQASVVIQALEWVGMWRETYGIVAANMSFDFGGRNSDVETAVNNLADEGVVCVAAAGNRRQSDGAKMTSPAWASKCITVAALNESDQITSYSSYGGLDPEDEEKKNYKPDLSAPGGSSVTNRRIVVADSNDGEWNYAPPPYPQGQDPYGPDWPYWQEPIDRFPHDYTTHFGTSMSAPHVAGAVALIADALGVTTLTREAASRVRMLLLMTATETNIEAEAIPSPPLNRAGGTPAGWDLSEGYGRLNIDGAVDAALGRCVWDDTWRATLGSRIDSPQVWARRIRLRGAQAQQFWLDNPPGADFDLYLYSYTPSPEGRPVIVGSSTKAVAGGSESFTFTPSATQEYYLVVKRVSGSGEFTAGVWTTSARLAEGWHLISLPNRPVDCDPKAIFPWIPLHMRLYRYDPAIKGYVAYLDDDPGAFGDCDWPAGYWLYLDAPMAINYVGIPSQCAQEIALPEQGWQLIGYPFRTPNLVENFQVRDTVSGEVISITIACERAWLECVFYAWSPDLLSYISYGLSDALVPWLGYWVNTLRPDLALIMPVP